MAVLSKSDLVDGRGVMARGAVVTWTKAQVNAALQAAEDQFNADRARYAAAIETAAPGVFSSAEKKRLGGVWMIRKAQRELL